METGNAVLSMVKAVLSRRCIYKGTYLLMFYSQGGNGSYKRKKKEFMQGSSPYLEAVIQKKIVPLLHTKKERKGKITKPAAARNP